MERHVETANGEASLSVRVARRLAQLRADAVFAVVDAILIGVSYMTILGVRSLDPEVTSVWWSRVFGVLPVIIGVHLVANVVAGAYGHVWEYASIGEAKRVIAASFWSSAILILGSLVLGFRPVPLSVLIAGGLLSLGCLAIVRFRTRLFSFHRSLKLESPDRALILGVGKAAADVARSPWWESAFIDVVGFVSPHSKPDVRRLAGLPILGELDDVASLIEELEIDQVIVASEGASGLARRLVDLCVDVDVRLRIVPHLDEVMGVNHSGIDLRDLQLDDLLLRPPVSTDLASVEAILTGKRVLVTGAGGSIGFEIVTQVLGFSPSELVVLDNDETHLHDGMLKWEVPADTALIPALVDVRDRHQLDRVIALHEPQVVFHAAAHKHVPILEKWPDEAVKTNVLGTANLLESVRGTGVERFVLISTDKTVAPTGAMGASKRVAEMLVQSAAATRDDDCVYAMVRFGNVLGSRGSVVPTFLEQIRRGGPVTITDERMTRYFMTTGEAVELVLQASALADQGEVFVLDMGTPVRILDLAHRMIRLGGLVPGRDIEVRVSGARSGEKLSEQLAEGPLRPSSHPKINIATASVPTPAALHDIVDQLGELAISGLPDEVKELLLSVANREWAEHEIVDLRTPEEVKEWI